MPWLKAKNRFSSSAPLPAVDSAEYKTSIADSKLQVYPRYFFSGPQYRVFHPNAR